MSLLSNDVLGNFSKPKEYKTENAFTINSLDETISKRVDGLLMYEVINKRFNMRKLLIGAGCNPDLQNMYCPFHDDELTGKPSAKYHADTDMMYCFSESKMYTAYHALKFLYRKDMHEVFRQVWKSMSREERQEMLDKHGKNSISEFSGTEPSIWDKYKAILNAFKEEKVNYTQMKNGIYKVMKEDYDNSQEEEV